MTTFGLVHGAWHGAWAWDLLIPELRARGHDAIAMDLPCDSKETANTIAYAEAVEAALDETNGTPGRDDVVLVGHSLGGLTIPVVASRRPVRGLVYLCAVLRDPGRSMKDGHDDGPDRDMNVPGFGSDCLSCGERCSRWPDEPAPAIRWMYHDCEPALAREGASKLRRQFTLWFEPAPIDAWPDAPAVYILCREDRAVTPDWSRRTAPERFGTTPIELPGGHSPMLSRPAELADALVATL